MKVNAIMREVEALASGDSVQPAAQRMSDSRADSLPVCDQYRLVGMISTRDIAIGSVAEGKSPDNHIVRELMSEADCFAFEDDEIVEIANKMVAWGLPHLPVVSRDMRLVGCIHLGDAE
jgi:CBS domain-containing protein